jgi:hypothetical protein
VNRPDLQHTTELAPPRVHFSALLGHNRKQQKGLACAVMPPQPDRTFVSLGTCTTGRTALAAQRHEQLSLNAPGATLATPLGLVDAANHQWPVRGYAGQITLIKDFIRPIRAEKKRLQELTVRYETAPGEQAQIDWGEFLRLPDGHKLHGLSTILSWSRTGFVYFTDRMVLGELLYGLTRAFDTSAAGPANCSSTIPRPSSWYAAKRSRARSCTALPGLPRPLRPGAAAL